MLCTCLWHQQGLIQIRVSLMLHDPGDGLLKTVRPTEVQRSDAPVPELNMSASQGAYHDSS